jgi:fibronectin-binding autotransporter adhesin
LNTLLRQEMHDFGSYTAFHRRLVLTVLSLLLCPASVFAQSCPGTTNWNAHTGNWETAGHWSSGVPGPTSNTCINVASATVNVTASSGDTTDNLDLNLISDILDIENNGDLIIQSGGNIINNGTVNLQSSGSSTSLILEGNTTLGGIGTLTMSNSASNLIWADGRTATLVNEIPIQGSGNIGNGGDFTLVNNRIINANGSAGITIDPDSSGGITNTGVLEASVGSTLTLSGGSTVANSSGAVILADGGVVVLANIVVNGGNLTTSASGVIQTAENNGSGPTITNLQIAAGTTVYVPNSDVLTLGSGTITDNGTITLGGSGNDTSLIIAGNTILAGLGTVTMSNNASNAILTNAGSATLTNQETIQGSGNIGNNGLTLVNASIGIIDADNGGTGSAALVIDASGGTANAGTMEASSGGTLEFQSYTVTNTAGTIAATGIGSVVNLNTGSIVGGTLTSSDGGVINVTNNFEIIGVTISSGTFVNVLNNEKLQLGTGTIFNKGTINLESTGNVTELVLDGNVTLTAAGKVIMSADSQNYILGTGTLTNQGTIEGEGNIGEGEIALVNSGSILANESKKGTTPSTFFIDTNGSGFTNNVGTKNGILNVSAKNTLIVEGGPFNNMNASNGTLTGGEYLVAGELEFAAGSAGILVNDAAITLTGATREILNTTNNTNALTGFEDNGTKGTFVVNGGTFTDANTFTNSGIIAVGSGGKFDASTALTNFNSSTSTLTGGSYTLTATGQFQFNNGGDSSDIVTNDAKITFAGVDTTKNSIIDQTGANALANFAANGSSGSLLFATNRNYTTPGNFTNAGIVDVEKSTGTGHTQLTINGTYDQTGGTTTVDGLLNASAFDITGGFVYGNAGTVAGAATLTGNFDITGGAINPGDGVKKAGKLNISGTYTQSGSGILNIDLDGTTAGTNYDVLDISGAATLGGTLDVDAIGTFKPTAGQQYDILDYSSESGAFTAVDCTFSNGDGCSIAYDGTEAVLTITTAPGVAGSPASKGAASGSPAHRVSRVFGDTSAASMHEPTAILSRATCFAARVIGSGSCSDKASVITASHGSDLHEVASVRPELDSAHNNVMVATRSISSGRGGASDISAPSLASMARFYACAYSPLSVGHTMGCN